MNHFDQIMDLFSTHYRVTIYDLFLFIYIESFLNFI